MNEKVVNPLELKWARQKQQEMLDLFQRIPFPELQYTSRYLSSKIGYGAFMRYLKSIENAQPKNGSLLEVAEQAQIQIEQSVLNAEALWSEMPQTLQTIEVDVELLKQSETQLDVLRAISTKLIAALREFINGQYLNAAELYPMFKELCRLYEDFLRTRNYSYIRFC